MKYFENSMKLRMLAKERYKAHQQIDTFIQERLGLKLPYSWSVLPFPGAEHYSLIQVRSAFAMKVPGEKVRELVMQEGQIIAFQCNFCSEIRYTVGEVKKARIGTTEEVEEKLKRTADKNGLQIISCTGMDSAIFDIKKPKNSRFVLGEETFSVVAMVTDVSLAEKVVVEGLGVKKMFGFGFLSHIEAL